VGKPYRVAITGASGFLGSELVNFFSAKGWKVNALVRQPSGEAPVGVKYFAYDMTRKVPTQALADCDFLIHAAYIKQDKAHPDAMKQNVFAAKNLVVAAKKAGLRKSLFISSMSAHDDAVSVYGKQKLRVEQLFNGSRDVIIRSGMIIGKGGIVLNMANFMKKAHAVPLIAGGTQPIQIVAVHDLARVIEKALISETVRGTLTIGTPKVYSYKEFYAAIAKSLGIKVLFVPIPFNLLRYMLKVIALLRLPLNINEENLLGMKKLRSFETAKDLKKVGVGLSDLETALTKARL